MATRIIKFIFAVAMLGCSSWSYASPGSCDYDQGRLLTCVVTFDELWREKNSYAGLPVTLSGYLVARNGKFYLFPGKDYFLYQGGRGALKIDVRNISVAEVERNLSKLSGDWSAEIPCPVTIMGTFLERGGDDFATLGVVEVSKAGLWVTISTRSCLGDESGSH